jgi:hypothetical protein
MFISVTLDRRGPSPLPTGSLAATCAFSDPKKVEISIDKFKNLLYNVSQLIIMTYCHFLCPENAGFPG